MYRAGISLGRPESRLPDPHLVDWTAMILRWFHLVTGAAWIGASFYFVWLNNHVRPVDSGDPTRGLSGEVFAIHGGAFYRVSKFGGAPEKLPSVLHWFKWEAYLTWVTGILLLGITYWMDARSMMVDRAVRDLSPAAAVGVGAGSLVLGYVVYDLLCRAMSRQPLVLAALGTALFTGASYVLFGLLGARAATMHLGAMIGTIMAANVLFVIIPGQRAMVDAMVAGREPPLERGQAGALRSFHNNYFTLPALFVMVSNHYPVIWGHRYAWLLVVGICVLGGLIRHGFNLAGVGRPRPFVPSIVGALGLVLLAVVTRAPPAEASGAVVNLTAVQQVIAARCQSCHSLTPTQPGFVAPPKGLALDDRATIEANRAKIGAQVSNGAMPLGNITAMTDDERQLVVAWASGD